MLNILIRKLWPLMSLAIATAGCGKKITESTSSIVRQTENQQLPSSYVISLYGLESSKRNYWLPRPAQFEIPNRLRVSKGSTFQKGVEIAFDVNEFDSDDFQFKCIYTPSSDTSEMRLKNCEDYDGNDFGNVSDYQFSLRSNDIIQIRFSGARSDDLEVSAVFSMNWI